MISRITNNSTYIPYQRNLEEIQNRQYKEQIRLSTNQQILSIDDNPTDLVDVKQLSTKIGEKENYQKIIQNTVAEIQSTSGSLENISDSLLKIRDLSLEVSQIRNQGNDQVIASNIKGLIQDIVKEANSDFNGKLLFSGTKSTVDSINTDAPAKDSMPYEIIEETPTASNPSGLKVIFKGNENDRVVNKDSRSTEVINVKASQIFGDKLSALSDAINIYNLLTYKSDGTKRTSDDLVTQEDIGKLNEYQKNIANVSDNVNKLNSDLGTKLNRLDSIQSQMKQEVTRLNEFKSLKNETDVTKSTINLKKEETALQYTLQIGSRIMQNSLFDFLK